MPNVKPPISKHPLQPLEMVNGILRFKENKIVRELLNIAINNGVDLDHIQTNPEFSQEDQRQFAQLLGFSHESYITLTCSDLESIMVSSTMFEQRCTEEKARLIFTEFLKTKTKIDREF